MKYLFIESQVLEGINISFEYVFRRFTAREDMAEIKAKSLEDYAISITSGLRIKKDYYSLRGGVKIVSPGDIRDSIIEVKSLKMVNSNVVRDKDFVFYGDILVTAAGRSGQIVFVSKDMDGYTNNIGNGCSIVTFSYNCKCVYHPASDNQNNIVFFCSI